MIVLLAAAGLGALSGPVTGADDLPAPIDFSLRNVRFQVLPDEVNRVFVGPDQRVWLVRRSRLGGQNLAPIRRLIEREFSKDMPQLAGAEPALFEPGGRVWFIVDMEYILGYDGRSWTEVQKVEGLLRGVCPNHGSYVINVLADGGALFPADKGVYCFDGKKWAYERLNPKGSGPYDVILAPLSDGKTVLACLPRKGLWQWRGGQWSQVNLPTDGRLLERVVPWSDGRVLIENLHRQPYFWRDGEDMAAEVATLVDRLGNEQYEIRQGATQDLIARGTVVLDLARQTLAKTTDPEVRTRLQQVIAALAPAEVDKEMTLTLGPYRLRQPKYPLALLDGPAPLVWAQVIERAGQPIGPGFAVLAPNGSVKAVVAGQADEPQMGLVRGPGNQLWLPSGSPDHGARLMDLAEGKFLDEAPLPAYRQIEAARADGTVFLRPPGSLYEGGLIAYKPGAPDDRRFLEAKPFLLADGESFAVGPDGGVWASLAEQPGVIQHFDGRRWQPAPQPLQWTPDTAILAGRDGTLLAAGPQQAWLLAGDKVTAAETLEALIERCRKEVAAAFKPDEQSAYFGKQVGLVADAAGSVWLLRNSRALRVLTGDGWIDAGPALAQAGWPSDWRIGSMAAVGDGRRLHLSETWPPHSPPRAFFVEVKNKQVALAPAPPLSKAITTRTVREAAGGALWISGGSLEMWEGGQARQLAIRAGPDGPPEEHKGIGWAWLCDLGATCGLAADATRGPRSSTFGAMARWPPPPLFRQPDGMK